MIYTFAKLTYLYFMCAALAVNNKYAAIMLCLGLLSGRATTYFGLSQSTLLVAYLLLAVVAVFFVDWVSGLVLVAVTVPIALGMMGFLEHSPKVKIGEAAIFLGIVFCGISGPSGGIWSNSHRGADRLDLDTGGVQEIALRRDPLSK